MKSGIAAMIDAARIIGNAGGLERGRLLIACVVDEEHSSIGAEALVTRWRADAAVVTEPTDLAVAVAHKGFEWVEIETEGRAAHGSRPREGRDAIRLMGRVLVALEALDRDLQSRPEHPRLGTASLHASLISGGRELSSYPDRCHLQMERRTLPGERTGIGGDEVESILAALRSADPDFRAAHKMTFARSPYEIAEDHALPQAMLSALARTSAFASAKAPADKPEYPSTRLRQGYGGQAQAPVIGMSFWTDAAVLGGAGIPSILFGPTGAGLHSIEEWVETASVLACRDALVELVRAWC
jgi:acetylornithine deacetylase